MSLPPTHPCEIARKKRAIVERDHGAAFRLGWGDAIEWATPINESLQRQLAEKEAELERVRGLFDDEVATWRRIGEQDAAYKQQLRSQLETARQALEEIREEWAGAECGQPKYAQEAYAIDLARRMFRHAAEALAAIAPQEKAG